MTVSFILKELITCGAVLSTFELVEALRRQGVDAHIVSGFQNEALEDYFSIKPIQTPKGTTIAVSPKCEGEYAYVRTKDIRWLKHKSKKIAVSQWIADWLKENGQESIIIGNGTHERFYDMHLKRDIDVLICGNYEPNKNIEATIEKVFELRRHSDYKIVWFGRNCGGNSKKWEGVEVLEQPHVQEIPRLYNRAKVFLSMSKEEGWGRPIAEATACGCKVINLNGGNKNIKVVKWEEIANQFIKEVCQKR